MRYPGGKNGSGVYQEIINRIPLCQLYIELYGGSYAIGRKVYTADFKLWYNDIDRRPEAKLKTTMPPGTLITHSPALEMLNVVDLIVKLGYVDPKQIFIYLDPPYLLSTRRSGKKIYRNEMTEADHVQLLNAIGSHQVNIMISGYRSQLYDTMTAGWFKHEFEAMTRKGKATEVLWMNYNIEDYPLLCYDYIGENFTKRQQIKRKADNMSRKLKELPTRHREFMLSILTEEE